MKKHDSNRLFLNKRLDATLLKNMTWDEFVSSKDTSENTEKDKDDSFNEYVELLSKVNKKGVE